MGLCFGFVLKTVLIIQRCFSYCWAVLTQRQGLFCLSPHPPARRLGGTRSWEGHSRDSWPQLTKGMFHTMPHDVVLSNKSSREVGGGGGGSCCLGSGWALVGWWWAIVLICITCLSWVLIFSLFVPLLFLTSPSSSSLLSLLLLLLLSIIIKLFLSPLMSFLTFTLPILFSIPPRMGQRGFSEWVAVWCLVASQV